MKPPNYIAFAIPFFFLLMGIELLLAWRLKKRCYRFEDALTDMACGVTQQVLGMFLGLPLLAGYTFLFERYRLITFDGGALPWAVAAVGVDFLYYWWHRASHEVNVLWAAHIVHHQSEDYNLAVALRQAIATNVTGWVFYLPLAFLGVPPLVFVAINAFSTLYQFWIHTELVGDLGPLEQVINTPALHRVHHAINPRYIDKNYGATLMVWDRLFGTWEPESEPCVYGIVKPLNSFNPAWAQVHYWVELARDSWNAPRLADKLRLWVMPPTFRARGLGESKPVPQVDRATFVKYRPEVSRGLKRYLLLQEVALVSGTFVLLLLKNSLADLPLVALTGLVLVTLQAMGGLIEGKRWAVPLELARLALGVALAVILGGAPAAIAATLGFAVVSAALLLRTWQAQAQATLTA